jgi:hypothetical protein
LINSAFGVSELKLACLHLSRRDKVGLKAVANADWISGCLAPFAYVSDV